MSKLVKPLRPMEPVISPLDFCLKQFQIVPRIDGKSRKEETRILRFGSTDGGTNAIRITHVFQGIRQIPNKIAILFRQGEWIRKGFNLRSNSLFDRFLGITQFV